MPLISQVIKLKNFINFLESQYFDNLISKKNTLSNIFVENNIATKDSFSSDHTGNVDFISPKFQDFQSSASFLDEEKNNLNKLKTVVVNKVFYPNKFKKKVGKSYNEILKERFDETGNVVNINALGKNLGKMKLYPINYKTLSERKENSKVKNHLTISLNNELSRVSNIYGPDKSQKNIFSKNPKIDEYYNERDYLSYQIAKKKELSGINIKPKLKPLFVRDSSIERMTQKLFFLDDNKKALKKII